MNDALWRLPVHLLTSYSPECVEGEISEVPIAPVQHESGLIYGVWAMVFRSYRAPLAHPLAS
jgi:hypothetical protein